MENYLTTTALVGLIQDHVQNAHAFALTNFFGDVITEESEEVSLDREDEDLEIAMYVASNIPAVSRGDKGFRTETFKPAYIKELDTIDPVKAIKRRPGEDPRNPLTAEERRDLHVAELLQKHDTRIRRRKEQMAWEVLRTGGLIMEGPNFKRAVLNFDRDPSLVATLTGGGMAWDQDGVSIIDYFEDASQKTQDLTGFAATTHILGGEALKAARKNEEFKEVLDNRRQATGLVELGPIAKADGDAPEAITGARFVGTIGDHEIWTFGGKYKKNGVAYDYFGSKEVLSINPMAFSGFQLHGAILDHDSLQAMEMFSKSWDNQNPSVRNLLSQAAPLLVPGRINATVHATVL